MGLLTITTTHRPEFELEVEPHEFLDLQAQGLIHSILGGDLESVGLSKKDKTSKGKKTAPKMSSEAPADESSTSADEDDDSDNLGEEK